MIFSDQPWLDAGVVGFGLSGLALVWVVLLIRANGLRSLSKMTNFDFVMTVALGSLVAGAAQVSDWAGAIQIAAGMVGLFVVQNLASRARRASDTVEDAMQNQPVLLMKDGEICDEALKSERVARSDLIAKLREANALDWSKVQAVVLETTGDVSVLHGDGKLDDRMTKNIRDLTE